MHLPTTHLFIAMHILLTVLKHIIKLKSRRLAVFATGNKAAKELSQKIIALIGKVCSCSCAVTNSTPGFD